MNGQIVKIETGSLDCLLKVSANIVTDIIGIAWRLTQSHTVLQFILRRCDKIKDAPLPMQGSLTDSLSQAQSSLLSGNVALCAPCDIVFNGYSSGLSYYYFVSGLLSIITMWYLRWSTDDKKLLAGLEAYHEQHKNDPKKVSGLQARLEALQKMQQEQAKRR